MVFSNEDKKHLIHSMKLSSVGPGRSTGSDVVHQPSGMDLAMKLHYIIGVYLFRKQAVEGLSTMAIKEYMFYWLNDYYVTCGRFRRPDSGRPYMKCNDCGARFIEAQCEKTMDEWLEMRDFSPNKQLVYHLPLGPELSYSPPVYLQLTWFKCGGMSLGLSWAHILGDAFSACEFINMLGKVISEMKANGPPPAKLSRPPPSHRVHSQKPETQPGRAKLKDPLSINRVNPVGEHWVTANNFKMDTFSFHLMPSQMTHLQSNYNHQPIPIFESLCAVIWKCVAKIRNTEGLNIVTICKMDSNNLKNGKVSNNQVISTVEAKFSIPNADLEKLTKLLANEALDERGQIMNAVEKDNGTSDFVLYGANLTFLNMEEVNIYGLELNGSKANLVWYGIQGVGDKGAVVVIKDSLGNGRMVTITLPEDELLKLKLELKLNGLLLDTYIE